MSELPFHVRVYCDFNQSLRRAFTQKYTHSQINRPHDCVLNLKLGFNQNMKVPLPIQEALTACHQSFSSSGEPSFESRRQLLLTFEALGVASHTEEARYRRTLLAIKCAQKSLAEWETVLPTDREPHLLLELLASAMCGKVAAKDLESRNNAYRTHVDDVLFLGEAYHPAAYAGFSCFAAVAQLLYDDVPEFMAGGELEVDPQEWGAEFLASLAYCGGAVWENIGSPECRREFWLWYLDEAVPSAFNDGR